MPVAASQCEWVVVQNGQHEPIQRPLARCRVAEGKKQQASKASWREPCSSTRDAVGGLCQNEELEFCPLGLSDFGDWRFAVRDVATGGSLLPL